MRNIIPIMAIGLLIATNVVYASAQKDETTLSKSDSQMLFGEVDSKVLTLKQDEMKKTEGKYWDTYSYITNITSLSIGDTIAITNINIHTVIAPTIIIAPTIHYYR
jgi:hypothetical protein